MPFFIQLSRRTQNLTGWRRNATAFSAGVAMTFTLPPIFLLPFLIPAFTILYWLIEAAPTTRRAFADGWWWGMGWHMTGLYWFCIALLTDPEKFAWLIPFTLIGLNAIIALYAGIACGVWKRMRCSGLAAVIIFSLIWVVTEYARGYLFTGFPWNLAGYSFAVSDALMQSASLVGIYGLTWFAVLLGVVPAALTDAKIRRRKALAAIIILYGLLAASALWGAWRLDHAQETEADISLRLVQANIDQNHKWDPALRRKVIDEQVKLSQSPGAEKIDYIIWPETAVPFALKSDDVLSRMLAKSLPPQAHLITGAIRIEGTSQEWEMFNSIVVISPSGKIVGSYDKVKLVPFGEFVPFRSILPSSWLTPAGDKDFSRGKEAVNVTWPSLPALTPLICYEVIFPEFQAATRPKWLLNLTNDAWFGHSTGPHQHFQMARFRAIEQGVPLVRVANTGISGMVDSYGRVVTKMGLEKKGFLDIRLLAAKDGQTLYSVWGIWILPGLILLLLTLTIGQYKAENN